ncbi:MAG TPA: hypothetical protein VL944_01525 [Candidatus Acidoferrum sp.]|nr:hypothetical protein [Candidatus Acidoferrum sp.]
MAFIYNISIEILELIYIFSIALAMDLLVERKRVSKGTARKIIHLWMGGLIVFWFLFNSSYAQLLFAVPPLAFIGAMLSGIPKGSKYFDKVLKFAKMNDIYEVVYGPLIFVSMFVVFTLIAFRSFIGVAALCAMVFGDGIAPIVGKYARNRRPSIKKTFEGSVALFFGSLISIYVFLSVFFPASNINFLFVAASASAVAMLVEVATPGNYDNLTVPLSVWVILLAVFMI